MLLPNLERPGSGLLFENPGPRKRAPNQVTLPHFASPGPEYRSHSGRDVTWAPAEYMDVEYIQA
jgi:hypothetical protein